MAEKDMKKEGANRMVEVFVLVLMVFFVWLLIARIRQLLSYYGDGQLLALWEALKNFFFEHLWPIIKILAFVAVILSIYGMRYNKKKLAVIQASEDAIFGKPAEPAENEPELKNPRWEKVLQLSNSHNESDWRQAIIEADIMLEEMLTASGYHGDSIGDKLKSVEPSDFLTLDSAWSAHKVRNRIAHDGASYLLNEREVKVTISQFEIVFKEFKVI